MKINKITKDILLFGLIFILGSLCALWIFSPFQKDAQPVKSVFFDEVEVKTGNPRSRKLLSLARKKLQKNVQLIDKETGFSLKTTFAKLGCEIDMKAAQTILVSLSKINSPMLKYYRGIKNNNKDTLKLPLPVTLNPEKAVESLAVLKELIDKKPANAFFDFALNKVTSESYGRELDVYETLYNVKSALASQKEKINLAIKCTQPPITQKDLEKIKVDKVMGFFETRVSRMEKDKNRTHNVTLGCKILNGTIILPGETFSFNDTLGDRSQAKGFRYAPVIAGGVIVEGMGGGTCQIASTLYAAAFFTGLVIVDRKPHSRPSSYIKLGLDATVSYPNIDLKIKNIFDFPVVIHSESDNGKVKMEILGQKRPFTVTLLRKVVHTQPYPVRTLDDPGIARGRKIITQKGVPGYTVRRYQIIEKDKVAYRHRILDKYPPTAQYIHRGTGDKSSDEPKADTHKPYRASTYLRMVQGTNNLWYESSHE